MTEDPYMDDMRRISRGSAIWLFASGVALGAMPSFAIWFAASGNFYAGVGTLALGWIVFIALGRAETGIMRILTELSSLDTIVTLYTSNSRGLHPKRGGLAGVGGGKSDGGICPRPTGTVHYFSEEIARHK